MDRTPAPQKLEQHRRWLYALRRDLVERWLAGASVDAIAPRLKAVVADLARLETLRQIQGWYWTEHDYSLHYAERDFWTRLTLPVRPVRQPREAPSGQDLRLVERRPRDVIECDCSLRGSSLPSRFYVRERPFSSMPVINYFASPARSRLTLQTRQVCKVLEKVLAK
jgi:hypothetical protein